MSIIQNAIIESVRIDNDDHGLLSAWLMLDYGGSGQGFGGYTLYLPKNFTHSTNQKNYAGHFIWRCMEVGGVAEWNQLRGKTIRVKKTAILGPIEAIGHIVKEDWFDPKLEFAQLENRQMVSLNYEQKLQALQALGEVTIHMREPGDWYAYLPGAELGGNGMLLGTSGNGATPQVAINDYWEQMTNIKPPYKYIVLAAYNDAKRKHVVWNGFMWKELPIEATA
jgi:hypothetical protein